MKVSNNSNIDRENIKEGHCLVIITGSNDVCVNAIKEQCTRLLHSDWIYDVGPESLGV